LINIVKNGCLKHKATHFFFWFWFFTLLFLFWFFTFLFLFWFFRLQFLFWFFTLLFLFWFLNAEECPPEVQPTEAADDRRDRDILQNGYNHVMNPQGDEADEENQAISETNHFTFRRSSSCSIDWSPLCLLCSLLIVAGQFFKITHCR